MKISILDHFKAMNIMKLNYAHENQSRLGAQFEI